MPYFAYKIHPYRENFVNNATDAEMEIVSQHFEYLKDLLGKKELLMAGRTNEGEFGIAIFDCTDELRAKEITENDPAVKQGIFIAEVYPFSLALYRNLEK